jgi:hypothetical protein
MHNEMSGRLMGNGMSERSQGYERFTAGDTREKEKVSRR